MELERLLAVIFSCLVFGIFQNVHSVGTGKVVIGNTAAQLAAEGLSANPEVYSLSQNQGTGSLPIYLELLPTGTPYDSDVQVFCETVPSVTPVGFARFTFTNPVLTLAVGTTSGNVNFAIVEGGREIEVQCYGVSQGGTAPIQFSNPESMSTAVKVLITNPPTVNFCSDTVIVPNVFGLNAGSFNLKLSEPVEGNNVTVGCTVTTNTAAGGFLGVGVANELVLTGASSVTMNYGITTAVGNDVTVSCDAQSENGGTQFLTATSSDQAIFIEDAAKIKFYPSELKIQDTVFETILALDAPLPTSAQDVTFACTTSFVIDKADIKSTVESHVCVEIVDSGTSNTTDTPSTTPEWVVSTPSPVFKPGQNMKQIRVERNFPIDSVTQENILLICCAPTTVNQSPKYMNEVAHTLIRSEMTPLDTVDFINAPAAQFAAETVEKNPAFIRLSPCPCDLIVDVCDIGCCCDTNCTTEDKALFDCLPGIFGGAERNGPKDESCSANPFPKPNWHNIMCVISEENPLIGFTFPTPVIIKTNNQFLARETAAGIPDNFFENETRTVTENVNTTLGYVKGISIKTQGEGGLRGILTLPTIVFDGKCERNSPVRYLNDLTSACNVRMTEAECKNIGGVFNARTYVQNPAAKSPACPNPIGISSGPGAGTRDAPVTANYYCPTSITSRLVSKAPPAAAANTFAAFNHDDLANCTFNDAGQFDCLPAATPVVTSTPPHCTFDDGETLPPAPVWDAANQICRDAVLDVHYKFTWSGTEIMAIEANYVLGDVPLTSSYAEAVTTTETVIDAVTGTKETQSVTNTVTRTYPTEVNQKYRVEFTNAITPAKTIDPDVLPEISGNPGYKPYKPVIGAVRDNVTKKFDASKTYWPKFFVPTSESLECTEIGKDFVKFDEQVSSTCLLHLSLKDFEDCDLLRRYFLAVLDSTLPMNFLSSVGNPNMSEPSHWIPILRQDLSFISDSELLDANATNTTDRLPESLSRCNRVPVGIRLDIMFADTGKLEDQFIQRITNAKITYDLRPVELFCGGAKSHFCVENSTATQPFILYSASSTIFVRFHPATASRWELFHYQCVQEFCKEEAMFPFTQWFQGGTYEESLLWMIAIFAVTIFIFMITRPWW